MNEHTVKSFDDDISQLRGLIAQMGGLAEVAIQGAMAALVRIDAASAQKVIEDDPKIDALEAEVERLAVFDLAGLPRGERLLVRARAIVGGRDGWFFFAGQDATSWQESSKFRLPRTPG